MTNIDKVDNKRILITALEVIGVFANILYTYLYIKGIIWCWLFALIGASIYAFLCYEKKIYAEVGLQFFYVLTAIYGYLNWGEEFHERSIPIWLHIIILIATIAAYLLLANFIKGKSKAPFLDSFTTVFSISGTMLMVNFIHINWLYWIASDLVSIFLYNKRGLKITVSLYVIYLFLSVFGLLRIELPFL